MSQLGERVGGGGSSVVAVVGRGRHGGGSLFLLRDPLEETVVDALCQLKLFVSNRLTLVVTVVVTSKQGHAEEVQRRKRKAEMMGETMQPTNLRVFWSCGCCVCFVVQVVVFLGVWDILERRRQDGSIHSWGQKRGKNNNLHLHVKGDEAPPPSGTRKVLLASNTRKGDKKRLF
jgi:hypothetical protein